MMQPMVSVVMSVYNGERFLYSAIQSILNQTFSDFEFLIMDDGSTDGTENILREFQKSDKRIALLSQANKGLAISLNTLINKSKGKYIARMDADDISIPERLESQMKYLDNHPEHALVAGGCLIIDNDDKAIGGKILKDDPKKLKEILFSGNRNPFTHGLLMFRKQCLDELTIVYRFRYSQDFDLLLRLASQHPIGAIERVLYFYREGSSLQGNFNLAIKRKKQHKFLLSLRENLLFDDDFCISQIEKIFSKKQLREPADRKLFQMSKERIELKKHFMGQNFQALRRQAQKSIVKYGPTNISLLYLILSFFPVSVCFLFVDMISKAKRFFISDRLVLDMTVNEIIKTVKKLKS